MIFSFLSLPHDTAVAHYEDPRERSGRVRGRGLAVHDVVVMKKLLQSTVHHTWQWGK